MNRWLLAAFGLGAYIAFTLATFPAGIALRWFAPAEAAFAGVAGTLWSGSAASCSFAGFTAESLRWRLKPMALLLGRVSADIEARIPDGIVAGNITASPGTVSFADFRGETSLPALAAVLPVRGMRGRANVRLESLVLDDGWPTSAVGELRLTGLEAAPLIPNGSSALLPLGDYIVTLLPASAGEIAATVVDNGGPLEVQGTVRLDTRRAYTIDALVKPRPGAPEMLVEGLRYMSTEPDAEGRRRLNLTGTL